MILSTEESWKDMRHQFLGMSRFNVITYFNLSARKRRQKNGVFAIKLCPARFDIYLSFTKHFFLEASQFQFPYHFNGQKLH